MNKKYLFGMLFSGALLAACTADDLNVTTSVTKEANSSAPVFTVGFEDGDLQNRASYNGASDKNKVDFEENDEMSLFHGILTAGLDSLTDWQNAIYVAQAEGDDGLDFKTQAMVQPGYAIMVWPAEKGFDQTDLNDNLGYTPRVKVNQVQYPEDRANVPYFSEVIEITQNGKSGSAYDKKDKTAGKAGYGNKYEILLRRAAGTLQVRLTTENKPTISDVLDFKIKAVEINMEGTNGTKKPFSVMLPLKANTAETNKHANYKSWRYQTEVDRSGSNTYATKQVGWMKTFDIENDMATFTLLPGTNSATFHDCDGYVKVYTTWGNVVIKHDEKAYGANYDEDINTRMAKLVETLWYDEAPSGEFEGEPTGGFAGTFAKVDLKNLDLDKMHITTNDELKTAIAVYKEVYKDKTGTDRNVTLYLDGDAKNQVFEMDAEVLDLVAEQMEATAADRNNNGLKFKPCDDEDNNEKCTKVKVTNKGTEKELPAFLKFEDGVILQLAGKWTFKEVTDISTNDTNNEKFMDNVNQLDFLSGASLVLENEISVSTTMSGGIYIEQGATVTVDDEAVARVNLSNEGTINIGVKGKLLAGDGIEIKNVQQWQTNPVSVTGLNSKGGYILNKGMLATVNKNGTGKINNYGTIEIEGSTAQTMINDNQYDTTSITATLQELYSSTNVFGTIILPNANGNDLTEVKGKKGFIKLTITKNDPTKADVGMANYLVLADGVTHLTTEPKDDKTPAMVTGVDGVRYIQVASTGITQLAGTGKNEDAYKLAALIVPANGTVQILKNAVVAIDTDASKNPTGTVYVGANAIIGVTGQLKWSQSDNIKDDNQYVQTTYFGAKAGKIAD